MRANTERVFWGHLAGVKADDYETRLSVLYSGMLGDGSLAQNHVKTTCRDVLIKKKSDENDLK